MANGIYTVKYSNKNHFNLHYASYFSTDIIIDCTQKKNRGRRHTPGSGKKALARRILSTPENKLPLKPKSFNDQIQETDLGLSFGDNGSRPNTQQKLINRKNNHRNQTRLHTRAGSRPTTQERSIELRRTSISRSSIKLDDIPRPQPPEHVEFSKYRRLGAIESQHHERLSRVDEDSSNSFPSSNVVIPPDKNYHSYRESLVKHSKTSTDKSLIQDIDSREAWPRREVPIPLYMEPVQRRRSFVDPLHKSYNINRLRIPRELDDRPKTSPEILERRPGSGTNSLIGDRIQLKGPDDRLKEIVSILNTSRANSRLSHVSDGPPTERRKESKLWSSFNGINESNSSFKSKKSLSVSINSLTRRGTPPSSPPTPGAGALRATGSKEHRDILRQLIPQLNGALSRRSTPEDLRKGHRRPISGRINGPMSPPRLPPVTPSRKKRAGKRPRCHECGRHLKLTATYQCRCGNDFCDKHRLSETHSCTFDYRSEGRRLLQISNPLITPQRLPKI